MHDDRGVDPLKDLRCVNGIAQVMLNELYLVRERLSRRGADIPERSYNLVAPLIRKLLQDVKAEGATPARKQDSRQRSIVSTQNDARSLTALTIILNPEQAV